MTLNEGYCTVHNCFSVDLYRANGFVISLRFGSGLACQTGKKLLLSITFSSEECLK